MLGFHAIADFPLVTLSDYVSPFDRVMLKEKRPVLAQSGGLYRVDTGLVHYGSPEYISPQARDLVVILERVGLTVEGINRDGSIRNNPESVKLLTEIIPLVRAPKGTVLYIYAGGQNRVEDPVEYDGPFPFIVGEDISVEPLVEYAFLAIRFTSTNQPQWTLLGYDLVVKPTGEVYDE